MGSSEPPWSEVTPEPDYLRRREFIKNGVLYLGATAAFGGGLLAISGAGKGRRKPMPVLSTETAVSELVIAERGRYTVPETPTPAEDVTTYNNYYELGLRKDDPAKKAGTLKPRPWTVIIGGEVKRETMIDIDSLLRWFPLEERVYRMRCVEAWSMVIPWIGFPLGALIKKVEPTSKAKYVAFETLHDEEQLPNQRSGVLDWPYVEGLRLDEAMHPLALLAVGLYGRPLPGQNGAPLRLVVPWKYGFKGIKSIVRINLVEAQPETTWNEAAPREYGFYGNVNPEVDHPRWSQATERRIGEVGRRKTLPFNGYAEEVASLYAGLDPRKLY